MREKQYTESQARAYLEGVRDSDAIALYEALKEFAPYWTPDKILETPPSLFVKLRQALAKVEGK
jgi:hypothetical protein